MTKTRFHMRLLLAPLGTALALSGCAHKSAGGPEPVSAVPEAASLDAVIALLNAGDEAAARRQLAQIQRRDPGDSAARVLSESIDKDPVELLGPKSFSYTTQAGDTMIDLAERFLGNKLKFYQLARYNGMKIPANLPVGTVLHVPGEAPRPSAPKRTAPRPPAAAAAQRSPRPKPAQTPATAAPARANPALANQLRGAGLAALNAGKIDRAVALLGRAAALDPGNPLIARELSRAQRIAQTVRAHH